TPETPATGTPETPATGTPETPATGTPATGTPAAPAAEVPEIKPILSTDAISSLERLKQAKRKMRKQI
ncbi:MAG: hypothetical protein RDV48_22250, partial [Candidatus Eremiobacteraeota bacterium]|nr:hypothetical protein [Candidatus Eremiobacteraeota bacterium]